MIERWLIIAHEASNSGAPRMLLEILRGVKAARGSEWSCDIVMRRGGVLLPEFAQLGPVHLLSHPWSMGRNFAAGLFRRFIDRPVIQRWRWRRCVKAMRYTTYDLVYNNTATNEYLVSAVRKFGCPVLTHVHELAYVLRQFTGDAGVGHTLRHTDRFLAVSQAVADDLKKLGVAGERITVTPNFLPALPAIPDERERSILRETFGFAPDVFVVLGCGYIHWLKGTDLFVEVAASLSKLTPKKIRFIWLGGVSDTRFARKVERLVLQRGLQDVVQLVGPVANPGQWFAACDAVAITSRMESFSLVALEAAAAAKPVMGFSGARGLTEFIGSESGSLSPEFDPSAMASSLLEILSDPMGARQQGQRLRKKVAEGYLAESRIGEILKTVAELKRNGRVEA